MQDTLSTIAQNDTMQQIAVIVQGLFLAIGALISIFQKKRY